MSDIKSLDDTGTRNHCHSDMSGTGDARKTEVDWQRSSCHTDTLFLQSLKLKPRFSAVLNYLWNPAEKHVPLTHSSVQWTYRQKKLFSFSSLSLKPTSKKSLFHNYFQFNPPVSHNSNDPFLFWLRTALRRKFILSLEHVHSLVGAAQVLAVIRQLNVWGWRISSC